MQRVDVSEWLNVANAAKADGYSEFITYMAVDDDGVELWLRLRNATGDDSVLATKATIVPTLTALWPQSAWYEREIAETFGVVFDGHATTPLILAADTPPTMLRSRLLDDRQTTPWPGEKDPGGVTARRRTLPPGVAGGAR